MQTDWGIISENLKCALYEIERQRAEEVIHVHHDKHGTNNYALHASAKNRVRDNRECLIYDHVGEKEGNKEQVAILPDVLYLLGILLLLPMSRPKL